MLSSPNVIMILPIQYYMLTDTVIFFLLICGIIISTYSQIMHVLLGCPHCIPMLSRSCTPARISRSCTPVRISRSCTPARTSRSFTHARISRSCTHDRVGLSRSCTPVRISRPCTLARISCSCTHARISRALAHPPGYPTLAHTPGYMAFVPAHEPPLEHKPVFLDPHDPLNQHGLLSIIYYDTVNLTIPPIWRGTR